MSGPTTVVHPGAAPIVPPHGPLYNTLASGQPRAGNRTLATQASRLAHSPFLPLPVVSRRRPVAW